MSPDFKNNIKNFKTTSLAICRRNLSRTMSWTVFPRIYYQFSIKRLLAVLLASSTARNFNNIRLTYVIFWKMRIITEIFDSWKIQNVSIFYFWKNSPNNGQIFQLFILYSKGHHFSITKLDILIFCNVLHLEMGFWKFSWKGMVSSSTFWQKPREKHNKWDIEKNGIAYSTARNLKAAYLWNFHFH